jgi:hypothetical protein
LGLPLAPPVLLEEGKEDGPNGLEGLSMQLPFFGPRRDEVAATATDLITRYGLRAHDEASHLAELSARLRSRRHRVLYELAAREIETSFSEAQKRLGLRQRTARALA